MKIKTIIFFLIIVIILVFNNCSTFSSEFSEGPIKKDSLFVFDKNDTPEPIKIHLKYNPTLKNIFPLVDTAATEKEREYVILETVEGVASYYAHKFHGRKTASGEIYNMNDLTAAHKTFPFGTLVRVINVRNDSSVIVRINDRGPFIKGRIIDVSYKAAKILDMISTGVAKVKLEVLEWGK